MAAASEKRLTSSLGKLDITRDGKAYKAKDEGHAETWEDAAEDSYSSGTETGSGVGIPTNRVIPLDYPEAPPPTPASPSFSSRTAAKASFHDFPPFGINSTFGSDQTSAANSPSRRVDDDRRPEKTTAVASRLIAAGIGQQAPRRTQEQREYDRSMKLQEKKKREHAKEEEARKQREKEKAIKSAWED